MNLEHLAMQLRYAPDPTAPQHVAVSICADHTDVLVLDTGECLALPEYEAAYPYAVRATAHVRAYRDINLREM